MNIWLALALILAVVTLYLLAIEIFSVAFKLTGLSSKKIKFQVASLFTSTGFTTNESELIVGDDRRRKIATICMYTGHIFSVAFMGLIIKVFFSLVNMKEIDYSIQRFTEWYFIVLYITSGLFILMIFLKIPPINKHFQKFLEALAINSTKKKKNTNDVSVMILQGKNVIAEVLLNTITTYMLDKPLSEMELNKNYSVNVLSIKRGKRIIDVTKDSMFRKGDILIVFGLINDIKQAFITTSSVDASKELDRYNEINLINNYGSNALVEVYVDDVPEELIDVKMSEAHLKDRYNITIGMIKRNDQYVLVDKNTVILKGDTLALFGPYKNIKLLFKNDDKDKDRAE